MENPVGAEQSGSIVCSCGIFSQITCPLTLGEFWPLRSLGLTNPEELDEVHHPEADYEVTEGPAFPSSIPLDLVSAERGLGVKDTGANRHLVDRRDRARCRASAGDQGGRRPRVHARRHQASEDPGRGRRAVSRERGRFAGERWRRTANSSATPPATRSSRPAPAPNATGLPDGSASGRRTARPQRRAVS
jgi:hypothetical protein